MREEAGVSSEMSNPRYFQFMSRECTFLQCVLQGSLTGSVLHFSETKFLTSAVQVGGWARWGEGEHLL